MKHTKANIAVLLDKLADEHKELARKNEDKGRYGVAYEHNCKWLAYQKASMLVLFASEFEKEWARLMGEEK